MKTKIVISLLLFSITALACALIPLTAAQEEGNMLTDGAANIWNTLSSFGGQAQEYVTTHIPETATIAGTGGAAGILGVAYKGASKAKNMLSSQVESLKGTVASVTEQANTEKEKLAAQLNEQTGSIQNQIKAASDKAVATATAESDGKILNLQNLNNTLNQQKQELQNQYKTLETRYNELKSIKAIP
jgi:archaellum component FlaC